MIEANIKAEIRLALGRQPGVVVFNNPVGDGWVGVARHMVDGAVVVQHARRVEFGLIKGASDLIGWRKLLITPDMVGQVIGQFVALEIKTPTGRIRPEQARFLENVRLAGGLGCAVRSVDEAMAAIQATIREP